MSMTNKRLQRLAESGTCPCNCIPDYEENLKTLANESLSLESSKAKSKIFKALADPIRLRILALLSSREMCVCEIMVALSLTQPTASHHLRILENVGLVKDRKDGKWVFYSIAKPELFDEMRKFEIC